MGNKMGNKKKNKMENKTENQIDNQIKNQIENKIYQLTLEFNFKFIGEFSYLIKLIEKCKHLNLKVKSKNLIVVKNNKCKIKLNLIDINQKDNNNTIADCIMMIYDINDEKGFEEIKLIWEEKLKKNGW